MDFFNPPSSYTPDQISQPAHPFTHVEVDDSFAVVARKNISEFKERMASLYS